MSTTTRPEFYQPHLTEADRSLAQQSFEAVTDPFRRSYEDRLEKTVSSLASKGIIQGGGELGKSQLSDIVNEEIAQESDIAKSIGSSIGQTAIERAYNTSELAKEREFLKSEREASQTYGTGERLGSQEFQSSESKLNREYGVAEREDIQQYQTGERLGSQTYGTSERLGMQDYQASQNEIYRNFTADQADLNRQLETTLQTSAQNFQVDLANLNTENQQKTAQFLQELTVGINPVTGKAYTQMESEKEMQTFMQGIQEDLFRFQRAETYGINPKTGKAYTQNDLDNFAYQRQLNIMKEDQIFKSFYARQMQMLTNGIDSFGNPLTDYDVQTKLMTLQQDILDNASKKAFDNAMIAEYGPDGVEIAKQNSLYRGDLAQKKQDFLGYLELNNNVPEASKIEIYQRILDGEDISSTEIQDLLPLSARNDIDIKMGGKGDVSKTAQEILDDYNPTGFSMFF